MSILTLPCDNGAWGVAFVTSARDKELRALSAVPAWDAALALFPSVTHWGAARPITSVQVIAAIEDRHRRYVVDGEPVVTGLAEINAEITGQQYQPGDRAWEISKALYAAAACDPDVLRAYTSVAAMTALPSDVLAEPGMLDRVIALGSTAPRYSAPGPSRAELLDALS